MATTLYFPTKASPTTTITLPDPRPGGVVAAPRFFTSIAETEAGTRLVFEHGGPERVHSLQFGITDLAQYDNLIDFIRTKTRGPLYTFEITILGVDYTGARFMTADFSGDLVSHMRCSSISRYYFEATINIASD